MKNVQQIASLALSLLLVISNPVAAQPVKGQPAQKDADTTNMIEELNPFDPNVEEILEYYDRIYEEETGKSAHLEDLDVNDIIGLASCYRSSCNVWAQVVKSSQRMYLYVNGSLRGSWAVSTGISGYGTPNFDRHPNGRIYDRYTSSKFPGGDYNGLGNMPYAVFITGGFALHGTPRGNWPKLGQRASHGCIRMHPDNAYMFNRLVRQYGKTNVWITVQ
ncbi:L,D-transpeptidase [Bdellovibrio bacteriovorus]|uniref:L,D-transpeptidase n=1 Tax=Bdellovibrio bacteriovorus TaxID=959 RepID=UPI0035A5EE83